jgi:hypothetical protein
MQRLDRDPAADQSAVAAFQPHSQNALPRIGFRAAAGTTLDNTSGKTAARAQRDVRAASLPEGP